MSETFLNGLPAEFQGTSMFISSLFYQYSRSSILRRTVKRRNRERQEYLVSHCHFRGALAKSWQVSTCID